MAITFKGLVNRFEVRVHRKIAKCFTLFSNRLSATKATSSGVASSVQPGVRNVMLEGSVNKDSQSVDGPSSGGD